MWFLPLLVIGAIVVAAASRSPRESAPPQQLALAPPPLGPISVLGEYVRVGHFPPPTVILCAIAEAEALGRDDIASGIIRLFVAPIVHQHELAAAPRMPALVYAPAPYAPMPAYAAYVSPPGPHVRHERGSCAPSRSPRDAGFSVPSAPSPASLGPGKSPSTDEEIRAMLSSDPERFIAMVLARPVDDRDVTRGPVIEVPRETVHRATIHTIPMEASAPLPALVPAPASTPRPDARAEQLPTGLPPEVVAQVQEAAGLHEAADQTRAMAPGSPILGVSDDAWRTFVMRLEREAPTFSSSRHVGQYRQHRDRLAELGIDPSALGSAQAQRTALDVDLVDAHHHAVNGGMLAEHVGRHIAITGHDGSETITLSGVLGVIQSAGLDGAVGWLERPGDRKRFPHTTQAFLRTNGVF